MRLLPPSPRGKIDVAPENRPINFPPKGNDLYVGGGNSNIFYFHSDPWGNDPIWQAYFSNGLVQPPTRYCIPTMPFFRLQTCCSFTRVPGISFWELREFPTETEQCQDNQLGSGGFEMPFNQVIKLHLESPGVYIIYDNYMIIYILYILYIYIPWASEPDKNVGFTSKPEVSKENPRFSKFMKLNDWSFVWNINKSHSLPVAHRFGLMYTDPYFRYGKIRG